jgi:hypothetical protein
MLHDHRQLPRRVDHWSPGIVQAKIFFSRVHVWQYQGMMILIQRGDINIRDIGNNFCLISQASFDNTLIYGGNIIA